jgi:hypothetical protein
MKPRPIWAIWLLSLLAPLALGTAPAVGATRPSRPNVVFIFADDQRPDTIPALGHSMIKTPSLDRLARAVTSGPIGPGAFKAAAPAPRT